MTYPPEFHQLWTLKPSRGPGNNKHKTFRVYSTRLKEGHTYKQMLDGMLAYKLYCRSQNILDTPYVMQLATFLGPNLHFLDDWTPVKALPRQDEELAVYAIKNGLSTPKPGQKL